MSILLETLKDINSRDTILPPQDIFALLENAVNITYNQHPLIRPRDRRNLPGGIVYLNQPDNKNLPVIVIPDLHGRTGFIVSVMEHILPSGETVFTALENKNCIVICVGDQFHGEARARDRWINAYHEYTGLFKKHRSMDEEMRESLNLMEMLLHLRISFPQNFFFLKGNHENIANEGKEGNYPFGKFVREGEMVTYWVKKFLGDEVFQAIYNYEKSLPILGVFHDFLVTHAEPAKFFPEERILNCYLYPEVIYAYTWTDNDAAVKGSVEETLNHYFPGKSHSLMFGGHRPVSGTFSSRAAGRYIQINNPDEYVIAQITAIDVFDPYENIFVLP